MNVLLANVRQLFINNRLNLVPHCCPAVRVDCECFPGQDPEALDFDRCSKVVGAGVNNAVAGMIGCNYVVWRELDQWVERCDMALAGLPSAATSSKRVEVRPL